MYLYFNFYCCGLTSPNPPLPSSLYCLNACFVMGCLKEKCQAQFQKRKDKWWERKRFNEKCKSSDLSSIFHCRKRSKYMLSWYCTKGSPLRYLWRSLNKAVACYSPSTAAWQWARCADSLSALPEDVLAGVELQTVRAVWFVLDHGGNAHVRLRREGRRRVT